MSKLLIQGSRIWGVDPVEHELYFEVDGIHIPKSAIEGYDQPDVELPEGFSPPAYQWIDGTVVLKPIVKTREELKIERARAVKNIVVTIDGLNFDGDETSQNRMARAIVAMKAGEVPTTYWTLADNTVVAVTVAQLIQALSAAGLAQTSLWSI